MAGKYLLDFGYEELLVVPLKIPNAYKPSSGHDTDGLLT